LPKDNQPQYFAESNGDKVVGDFSNWNFDWEDITHWLEQKEDVVILNKEQFKNIAKGIWDAGAEHLRDIANHNSTPTFEQYFKSLFN